jgi:hypothetical protein
VRAAAGITFLGIVVVCGALSGVAAAGDELDPVGTVTSIVSSVTSQADDVTGETPVVSDITGSATGGNAGSDLTGSLEGAATGGAVVSSSTSSGNSSTSSGDSSTSSGDSSTTESSQTQASADRRSQANGSARTRFDRLPRRYEVLLERVEFGFKLRASIDRLRALLASASPELRARILRLLRAEIRRLERGGLTDRERAAVRRLRHLRSALVTKPPPATATPTASLTRLEGAGVPSAEGGVEGTPTAADGSPSETPAAPFTGGPSEERPELPGIAPPTPPAPLDGVNWLWLVLSIVAGSLAGVTLVLLALELSARWPRGPG